MKRSLMLSFALFSAIVLTCDAWASGPVERTLTGCVVDKVFYSVTGDRAYPIRISPPLDLAPYEGRTISISGLLSPGDRFSPLKGSSPEIIKAVCDADAWRAINKLFAVQYRVAAQKKAREGNFQDAYVLINKALDIDRTDCDIYTDRAYIHSLRHDFRAASDDISVIKTRACANPSKANYLLLEDLGKLLEDKGRKQEALEAYRLALDASGQRSFDDTADLRSAIGRLERDLNAYPVK